MTSPNRICEYCGRSLTRLSRSIPKRWQTSPSSIRTFTTSPSQTRATSTTTSLSQRTRFEPTSRLLRSPVLAKPHSTIRHALRTFTTTTLRPATAIQNPRYDESGEPMSLEITQRASSRLSQIMANDKNPSLALRITVESGGCHGFQYLMSLTDLNDAEKNDAEEDTIFEGEDGAKVVMDEPSLELLKGSVVDYTMELIGSQFKVVNPMATSSCGCGTSFDIKVE